jgi:hypothetical protein
MHCHRFKTPPQSRRQMLAQCASGFGGVALAALLAEWPNGAASAGQVSPLTPRPTHFPPRATNVIFLYMDGGPSQIDSFDPKPRLDREHGQPIKMKVPATQFNNVGKVLKSPWAFRQYGQSGIPVSDLFPHVAGCVDELCIVRSMVSKFSEHTSANYFLHTGSSMQGRPSMGSWLTYGLGSDCQNLPGFVVLNGGLIPVGGLDNFGSGFLPASFQASVFKHGKHAVENVEPIEATAELQRGKLDLLAQLDQQMLERTGHNDQLESAIANYELAFQMQTAVPELMDLSKETAGTQRLYGMEAADPLTRGYGGLCLLARRLVERGVRFVELTCPGVSADRWDQHGNLKDGHEKNARVVDQPIAGLLKDLRGRGLLDSTLVVWGGEFGRTPMAQGTDGRDHNPFGFTMWLAGGGVKGGTIYGATDDYGYYAVENRVEIHDLHATMLHLLGIDHTRLTFRFGGRDVRLTDVHGNVVRDILS